MTVGDLVIEKRRLSKLRPHPQNSRIHSPSQVAQIVASIKEFGFTSPILIDETDTILAGHGRYAGAKSMKLAEVPVIVLRGLTEAQKRAYIIADNRIAEGSEWDKDKLMAEVAYLSEQDLSLEFLDLGSLDADLEALSNHEDETPEDQRDRKASRRKPKAEPEEDPAEVGGDPSKDKNSINFPLYVVLTPAQHKKWKAMRGPMTDKQFVAKLIEDSE